jgi:beta-lactam-binding protein with PASTA domain
MVVGLTQQVAASQIQAAGFRVNIAFAVVPENSSNIGRVITQSPTGGTEAPNGSTVTLIVGLEDPTPGTPPPTSSSTSTSTSTTSTTSTTSSTTSTTAP